MRFRPWLCLRAALPSLLVSIAATVWCRWGTGAGLGLFLCAPMLAAIFVPLLVCVEQSWNRVASLAGAVLGIALVWGIATSSMDVTLGEWFRCTLVLGAFLFALCGAVALLMWLRITWPVASLLTTVVALLWLAWPVWLSHALTQRLVDWLVPAHPLLAINGVVAHLGSWDRAPIAYRSLTILNQDIPYHLPRSIWPAVLLHLATGTPGILLSVRSSSMPAQSPAEAPASTNAPAPAPTDAP